MESPTVCESSIGPSDMIAFMNEAASDSLETPSQQNETDISPNEGLELMHDSDSDSTQDATQNTRPGSMANATPEPVDALHTAKQDNSSENEPQPSTDSDSESPTSSPTPTPIPQPSPPNISPPSPLPSLITSLTTLLSLAIQHRNLTPLWRRTLALATQSRLHAASSLSLSHALSTLKILASVLPGIYERGNALSLLLENQHSMDRKLFARQFLRLHVQFATTKEAFRHMKGRLLNGGMEGEDGEEVLVPRTLTERYFAWYSNVEFPEETDGERAVNEVRRGLVGLLDSAVALGDCRPAARRLESVKRVFEDRCDDGAERVEFERVVEMQQVVLKSLGEQRVDLGVIRELDRKLSFDVMEEKEMVGLHERREYLWERVAVRAGVWVHMEEDVVSKAKDEAWGLVASPGGED